MLFTLRTGVSWDQAQIVAHSLESGTHTVLINGGRDARYLPTGHLVYAQGATLFAVPFDAASLQVTGGAVPLVNGVRQPTGALGFITGVAHFAVAADGVLAYVPGSAAEAVRRTLVWVDREGREEPAKGFALDIPLALGWLAVSLWRASRA